MTTIARTSAIMATLLAAGLASAAALSVTPARAQSIIEDWAAVKAPAAPELKPGQSIPKPPRSSCSIS